MDARVRKRHVSTVRSVGGYRVMCSWRPADVMYGLDVDQWACFRSGRVSMLSLVLWAIPRGTIRAGWGMVRGRGSMPVASPFPSLASPIPVRGDVSEMLRRISAEPRNYLDGSSGHYRSAYPCTESSRGALTCRTRTGVCHRRPRLRDAYRTVPSSFTGSLAM